MLRKLVCGVVALAGTGVVLLAFGAPDWFAMITSFVAGLATAVLVPEGDN